MNIEYTTSWAIIGAFYGFLWATLENMAKAIQSHFLSRISIVVHVHGCQWHKTINFHRTSLQINILFIQEFSYFLLYNFHLIPRWAFGQRFLFHLSSSLLINMPLRTWNIECMQDQRLPHKLFWTNRPVRVLHVQNYIIKLCK